MPKPLQREVVYVSVSPPPPLILLTSRHLPRPYPSHPSRFTSLIKRSYDDRAASA